VITEADALAAVPPSGWIHDYVLHAAKQTTAPLGYHLAVGLSALAVSTPISFNHRYAGNLYGNLYTLLVGRSGEDQKSTALGIGRDIIRAADPELIGHQPGSWEGMVDSLAVQPRQIIRYSEFGSFLSKAQRRGGYFEPLKALLTDLWDCVPQSRIKANGNGTSAPTPRLSIMAAVSLPYLERHTEPHDWTGGFLGRWAVIYAKRERTNPDPVGDSTAVPALAATLQQRSQVPQAGPCLGLSDNAKKMWRDWFYELDGRNIPEIIAGAKTRAPTIARKIAMLYAWDSGEPLTDEAWHISETHLDYAIRFAELHLKSVVGLATQLAEHPDAAMRRKVLDTIPSGGARSLGQILLTTKLRKRTVMEVLEGLVLDGSLQPHAVSGSASDVLYARSNTPA